MSLQKDTRPRPASNGVKCPRAVLFDLDNTVAESFQPPHPHVASRLHELLQRLPVAIMSGASFERMAKDLLPALPHDADLSRMYLFSDTAAQCYMYDAGAWKSVYKFAFTKEEYENIMQVFNGAIEETGVLKGAPRWGDLFLARDTQVTFAGLGVDAPKDEKAAWDTDASKRERLKEVLDKKLSGLDIRISGRTAIDITRKGIDKAYGVRWLAERLKTEPKEMLFVGDALFPGGNDAIVIPTGIQTIEVAGPHETAAVIDSVLSACAD
ncbi:MAG: HAD-IIB family hydrolase [bacterium]|nr:HAD-IIB family hydrolase [bacterium]